MTYSPPYRKPEGFDLGARVPRLVNAAWLVRALRDNAKAKDGELYPWHPADLYRRAATVIEQHLVQRRP